MFLDYTELDIHTNPVRLPWTSDELDAEAATYLTHNRRTSMSSARFELAMPVTKQSPAYALDRMATEIGIHRL